MHSNGASKSMALQKLHTLPRPPSRPRSPPQPQSPSRPHSPSQQGGLPSLRPWWLNTVMNKDFRVNGGSTKSGRQRDGDNVDMQFESIYPDGLSEMRSDNDQLESKPQKNSSDSSPNHKEPLYSPRSTKSDEIVKLESYDNSLTMMRVRKHYDGRQDSNDSLSDNFMSSRIWPRFKDTTFVYLEALLGMTNMSESDKKKLQCYVNKTEQCKGAAFINRERLFHSLINTDGDRVKDISRASHLLFLLLTHRSLIIAIFAIQLFKLLFGYIIPLLADKNPIFGPEMLCGTLFSGFPCLLSFGFLGSYRGHNEVSLLRIMWSILKTALGKKARDEDLYFVDSGSTRKEEGKSVNPFIRKSIEYTITPSSMTQYELGNALILFCLYCKEKHFTNTHCDLYQEWRWVEERAGIPTIVFLVKLPLVMFWLLVIGMPVGVTVADILFPTTDVKSWVPFLIFSQRMYQILNVVYWIIVGSAIVSTLSFFYVTISVHIFQLEVFAARLAIDRLYYPHNIPQWAYEKTGADEVEYIPSRAKLIEEYLFHHYALTISSECWQKFVALTLLGSTAHFFYSSLYVILVNPLNAVVILGFTAVAILVFFLEVVLIAKLNGNVSSLKSAILASSKDDWNMYGVREELLDQLNNNPIKFSVFGFAITYTFLTGSIISIAPTAVGAVLTYLGAAVF